MAKNLFASCAKYYDFLVSKEDVKKELKFIYKVFNEFRIKTVLDLGCGTGLYLVPLKNKGFEAEGLDLSKKMIKEARKKNKNIIIHHKDMSKFSINKKYDAIICLSSSLLILPNFKTIEKTLKRAYEHLNSEGILLLDLPNHSKEIKECNNVTSHTTQKFSKGRLDSTFISYTKGKRWVEEWHGIVKEGNRTSKFKDIWEELIYSQKKLESSLKRTGFKILRIYGTMDGARFDKNKSYRKVYLCTK